MEYNASLSVVWLVVYSLIVLQKAENLKGEREREREREKGRNLEE